MREASGPLAPQFRQLAGECLRVIANVLQLPLRARAGSKSLGSLPLSGGISRLLHIFARLLELLPFFGHSGLVFRPVHALAKFVDITEHLLLFLLQAFEAAPDFFTLLLGFGFLKRRLQLLKPLVQVQLTARKLLQPILDLKLFASLRGLLLLRLTLSLIAIVSLLKVQLIELPLHLLVATATASLLVALAAHHLIFVLLQPQ